MATARSSSQPKGASCVIWYRDSETNEIMVLVGVESKYVRDRHTSTSPKSPKTEAAEKEQLKKLSRTEEFGPLDFSESDAKRFEMDDNAFKSAAKEKFEARVKRITAGSHIRFQFDTPVRKKDGSLAYEVRFRELKFDGPEMKQSKLGIIKGGCEDCDVTLVDTVVREVAEEVGMNINKSLLNNIGNAEGYACYSFQIEPKDVPAWNRVIADRRERHYGELFHLGFLPLISDIRVIPRNGAVIDAFGRMPQHLALPLDYELKINVKTKVALDLFLKWKYPKFSSHSASSKGAPEDKGKGGGRSGRRRTGSRKMIRRNRRGSRRLSRSRRR